MKATLGKKTVLSYPIPYAETFLSTDASDFCIAATLYQFYPSRKLRVPIALFSRKLSKGQFKYAMFDKEVLAIYKSVKSLKYMLDGHHFAILCDNQVVVQSLTKKNSEIFSHVIYPN